MNFERSCNDRNRLTIRELRRRFAEGSLSPLEYWLALETHIEAWEPSICALYAYDPEAARKQAQASTERWRKGETLGALDGIPVTLKELIATKGQPVPLGTRAVELKPAEDDARRGREAARRWRGDLCQDHMPGLRHAVVGPFELPSSSRNPWDLTQNPGGSSAGASAAAAAGYGPLHIGTDIGGSVRLPAGWTGIFGFKPSHGRIPVDPYYVGRCAGPMTRTVEDAAFAMATLSRPDWRDGTSLPPNDFDWMDLAIDVRGHEDRSDARRRLRSCRRCRGAVGGRSCRKALRASRCDRGPVAPVLTRAMLDGLDNFWRARFWGDIEVLSEERRSSILPYIHTWAKGGADVSGVDAVKGFNQTIEMRKACGTLFTEVDACCRRPIRSSPTRRNGPRPPTIRPAVRTHRLHGSLEHVGAAGLLDQLRFLEIRHADRPADRRPAL
jgi:aspartyl-tRNA(Asn)/glutamyl-tRNA(Gln) amidotransferase subunit A